jgi:hypothetical protein
MPCAAGCSPPADRNPGETGGQDAQKARGAAPRAFLPSSGAWVYCTTTVLVWAVVRLPPLLCTTLKVYVPAASPFTLPW